MLTDLQTKFIAKLPDSITLEQLGKNMFELITPYTFSDGDGFSIILKKENDTWILTDEGDTLMHLDVLGVSEASLLSGTKQKIFSAILEQFSMIDRDGELILKIENDDYITAYYQFTQALMKVSDIEFLSRSRKKKSFVKDFENLMYQAVDESRCFFKWHDQENDPVGRYIVDCKINSMSKPIMVFALNNNQKTANSTVTIHQLQKWNLSFYPMGIFSDMTALDRKTLTRFTDVCKNTYSNIDDFENRESAIRYIQRLVSSSK